MSTWVVFSNNNNTNAGVGTGSATNVQAVGHLCVIVVQLVDPGAQGRDAHVRPPQGLQRRRQREWGGDHRPVPRHRALQLGCDAQPTTRATTCETWERKSVEKSGQKQTPQLHTTTLETFDDQASISTKPYVPSTQASSTRTPVCCPARPMLRPGPQAAALQSRTETPGPGRPRSGQGEDRNTRPLTWACYHGSPPVEAHTANGAREWED